MANIRKIVRESGVLDTLYPAEQARHDAALRTSVDPAGRPTPQFMARIREPIGMDWTPGDPGRKRARRAGTAGLLAVFADTAPSTGSATVTLTMVTETAGETTLGTVRITRDRQFGEAEINEAVPAGAWLGVEVTTANGASGVSASLDIQGSTV